jgi:hypothetical protein
MLNDKELYSIVVIGAMNPRIHMPAWYLHFDLINKEEFDAAMLGASTLVTAQLSQFHFEDISVLCLPDRWEIKTTKRSDLDRMKAITQRIFDELLMHTPVFLIGFNFIWQKATNVANVARHLASRLVEMPFGLADGVPDSGEFSIRRVSENRLNAIAIGPSRESDSPSHVNIAINYEYKFENVGQFRLEDTAFARYSADQKEAEQQALLIVKALNEISE